MNKRYEPTLSEHWYMKQKRERRYPRKDLLKLLKIVKLFELISFPVGYKLKVYVIITTTTATFNL